MINKRPYDGDNDSYEFACKHLRQMDYIVQLSPFFLVDNAYKSFQGSDGHGKDSCVKCQAVEKLGTGSPIEVSDVEPGSSNSFPHSLWLHNETLEADNCSILPEDLKMGSC